MGTKRSREDEDANASMGATGVQPTIVHAVSPCTNGPENRRGSDDYRHTGSDIGIRSILRDCSQQCRQIFAGARKDEDMDTDRILPKVDSVRRLIDARFGAFWDPRWIKLAVGALVCFRGRRCDVGCGNTSKCCTSSKAVRTFVLTTGKSTRTRTEVGIRTKG